MMTRAAPFIAGAAILLAAPTFAQDAVVAVEAAAPVPVETMVPAAPAAPVAALAGVLGIADTAPPVLAEHERRYLSGFLAGLGSRPTGTHTHGLRERPAEYERRVAAFFHATLATPTARRSTPGSPARAAHAAAPEAPA